MLNSGINCYSKSLINKKAWDYCQLCCKFISILKWNKNGTCIKQVFPELNLFVFFRDFFLGGWVWILVDSCYLFSVMLWVGFHLFLGGCGWVSDFFLERCVFFFLGVTFFLVSVTFFWVGMSEWLSWV